MKNLLLARTALVSLALSAALSASASVLVQNGGFETGDFTGWSFSNSTNYAVYDGLGDQQPYEGTYFASLGTVGHVGTMSQSLTTSPGTAYRLDFYLQSYNDTSTPSAVANSLTATLGNQNLSLTNVAFGTVYQHYTLTATANSASTTLSFAERNDNDFFFLDGITVQAVPEPASMAALGLGALALVKRRRKA